MTPNKPDYQEGEMEEQVVVRKRRRRQHRGRAKRRRYPINQARSVLEVLHADTEELPPSQDELISWLKQQDGALAKWVECRINGVRAVQAERLDKLTMERRRLAESVNDYAAGLKSNQQPLANAQAKLAALLAQQAGVVPDPSIVILEELKSHPAYVGLRECPDGSGNIGVLLRFLVQQDHNVYHMGDWQLVYSTAQFRDGFFSLFQLDSGRIDGGDFRRVTGGLYRMWNDYNAVDLFLSGKVRQAINQILGGLRVEYYTHEITQDFRLVEGAPPEKILAERFWLT